MPESSLGMALDFARLALCFFVALKTINFLKKIKRN